MRTIDQRRSWKGFLIGCLVLGGFYWLLGWSGILDWGVIRRNRELGLNAAPLFYTEVDNQDLFKSQPQAIDEDTDSGN